MILLARAAYTATAGSVGYLTGHTAVLAAGGDALTGAAELIGALAALLSSITAAYLAFKKRTAEDKLIEALVKKQEGDDGEAPPRRRKRR